MTVVAPPGSAAGVDTHVVDPNPHPHPDLDGKWVGPGPNSDSEIDRWVEPDFEGDVDRWVGSGSEADVDRWVVSGSDVDVDVDVDGWIRFDFDLDLHPWVGVDPDVEAARLRHPSSGRWQPDHVRLARRFAEVLAASGARSPDVAAAALALRSRSGLDRSDFARELGVTDGDLLAVEAGACPVDRLPPPLAGAAFFLRVLSTL